MRFSIRALPIRWQITVLQAAILSLVLAGIGVLLWTQERAFLLENASARLRAEVRPIINMPLDTLPALPDRLLPMLPGDPPLPPIPPLPADPPIPPDETFTISLARLAQNLATRDTGALIIAPDGRPLARGRLGPPSPPPEGQALALAATGGREADFIAQVGEDRMLVLLLPLHQDGQVVALAQVSTPLNQIDDALRRLAIYLGIGSVLAVALATTLGVRATRHVLRPLEHMAQVSDQIAAGDLSRRVELPPGKTEIDRLGAAFDRMLERLEAAFGTQRRFIADAAHELRTPLTAMSASIELLLIGADNDDPVRRQRLLLHLNTELNRLSRLTNDLLTLSVLDAQPRMALQPIDLGMLLQELAEQQQLVGGQRFTADIAPDLWVAGDADRLRQMVLNLLDNARKYTPADGLVMLRAEASDQQVCITVQDSGVGIPFDSLPHLFERFYRVDGARTRTQGGSGLGLAIVQALAEAHGGRIDVQSAPGAGTSVQIWLPLAQASAKLQL